MPLDPVQHDLGKDDVVPPGPRNLGKGEHHVAHRRDADVEHLSPVHIELGAQHIQLGEYGLGPVNRKAGDLHGQACAVLGRPRDHQHVRSAIVADQQRGHQQTGQRRTRPVGEVRQRRSRKPQRRNGFAADELLQVDRGVVRRQRDSMHRSPPARLGQPDVERCLQIHLLEDRELAPHHRVIFCRAVQEIGNQDDDFVTPVAVLIGLNPLDKRPEGGGEFTRLRIGCARHEGTGDDQSVDDMPAAYRPVASIASRIPMRGAVEAQ